MADRVLVVMAVHARLFDQVAYLRAMLRFVRLLVLIERRDQGTIIPSRTIRHTIDHVRTRNFHGQPGRRSGDFARRAQERFL